MSAGDPLRSKSNTISDNIEETNDYGFCEGGGGGGLAITGVGSAQVIGNTLSNNTWLNGFGGGGIYINTNSPLIINNQITGNTADFFFTSSPDAQGGGIYLAYGSNASIIQNIISGNTGDLGGGVAMDNSSAPLLANNTFADDQSTQSSGSELYVPTFNAATTLINNLFINSRSGPALSCGSGTPTATNNDLFSTNGPAITGTCIAIGQDSNFSYDPLFSDAAAYDFQLLPGSPAIDAGSNSAPQLPASDYYGNPRIMIGYIGNSPTVDLGIAEVQVAGLKPSTTVTGSRSPTANTSMTPLGQRP